MDPALILELLGGGSSPRSDALDADLVRIIARLEDLIRARGHEPIYSLPPAAVQAWLKGDLTDAVAALQASEEGLSVADATTRLKHYLGDHPLIRMIERRIDQLAAIDSD